MPVQPAFLMYINNLLKTKKFVPTKRSAIWTPKIGSESSLFCIFICTCQKIVLLLHRKTGLDPEQDIQSKK